MNTTPAKRLLLASGSVTRKKMLEQAGVQIDVQPAAVDEKALKQSLCDAGASPRDIADALAEAKAHAASLMHPDRLILAADQILVKDGELYSKAADRRAAKAALQKLSGSSHQLLSAAVLYENGIAIWRYVDVARLTVRPLSDEFIEEYLDALGEDAFWSVGCYQLEGLGAQLFDRIDGDFFTILGLPLLPLLDFLRRRGILSV